MLQALSGAQRPFWGETRSLRVREPLTADWRAGGPEAPAKQVLRPRFRGRLGGNGGEAPRTSGFLPRNLSRRRPVSQIRGGGAGLKPVPPPVLFVLKNFYARPGFSCITCHSIVHNLSHPRDLSCITCHSPHRVMAVTRIRRPVACTVAGRRLQGGRQARPAASRPPGPPASPANAPCAPQPWAGHPRLRPPGGRGRG